MKAIILAGGEGTRLRPLSLRKPKPIDRPLLEHIVLLLRQNGFTELCMTLRYLPEVIRSHFGDGEDLGVRIEYRLEEEPLGTAGSVLACGDFIGEEDVLVISGDAACAFELRAMMEKHRLSGADVTILTRSSPSPLEYGMVLTEEDGRIRRFVEKPGPEGVVTDQINTGIYVLSPQVLREIPRDRSYDFGKELFPLLLKERRSLRAWQPEGYWNDVGTCEAYHQSCRDVLSGVFPLPGLTGKGDRFPASCWVSDEAEVAPDAFLGPGTVVGPGSRIGAGCRITDSILNGAVLESGCTVEGSLLEKGVHLGRNVRLEGGCVLSEGVTVGPESVLGAGVRLWPGVLLPAGSVTRESITHAARHFQPRFASDGTLSGEAVRELTPELLLRMGRSAPGERIAAAAAGGGYAQVLAESFLLGGSTAGRRTFSPDAGTEALAAMTGPLFGMDLCLFVRQEGERLRLRFTGPEGLPAERKMLRALEQAAFSDAAPAPAVDCSPVSRLLGTEEAAAAALLSSAGKLRGLRLSASDPFLAALLRQAGAETVPPGAGIPLLEPSEDGLTLSLTDEEGTRRSWEQLLCALTKAELQSGEKAVVLPYAAPAAAEEIAAEEGGTVYRLERDGEDALRRFRQKPWCRDGLTLGMRLTGLVHRREEAFSSLLRGLPPCHRRERTVLTERDTALLRDLARWENAETVSGVRFREGNCTVTVRRTGPGALRILAESASIEAAEEFCARLERLVRETESQ